jgi:hypothetical protein
MKLYAAIVLLSTTLFSFAAPLAHAGPLDQKLVDLQAKEDEAYAKHGNDVEDANVVRLADDTCDLVPLRVLYNEVKYSRLLLNNQQLLQSNVSKIEQNCRDAQSSAQASNDRLKVLEADYENALNAEIAYQRDYQKKSSSTQPNQ